MSDVFYFMAKFVAFVARIRLNELNNMSIAFVKLAINLPTGQAKLLLKDEFKLTLVD